MRIDNNHILQDGIVFKQGRPLPREEGDKLLSLERERGRIVNPKRERDNTTNLNKDTVCRQSSPTRHPVSDGSKYQTSVSDDRITFTGSSNQKLQDTKVKHALYAVTCNGKLLIHKDSQSFHHNFFYTDDRGIGKKLLCAGHLDVNENGKIVKIDNGSGHYRPNEKHLKNIAKYLSAQNLLTQNCRIHDSHHGRDIVI